MASVQIQVPDWLDRIIAWPVMVYRKYKYGEAFRRIYLGEGEYAIVDEEDYYRYGSLRWTVNGRDGKFYAIRGVRTGPGEIKLKSLHREIMKARKGALIDHRNSNSLDCRRSNLRPATHSENQYNKKKTSAKTSSKYIGVYYDTGRKKWGVGIAYKGKRKKIGRFDSEIEAARVYDAAAKKYHKGFAKLNFPKEIERSPRRLNLRSAAESRFTECNGVPIFGTGRLANWLRARLNFPESANSGQRSADRLRSNVKNKMQTAKRRSRCATKF